MKYEIIREMKQVSMCGEVKYRIRALHDIPRHNVKAGDLGGWVSSPENLSQEGDCWVAPDGELFDNCRVTENAIVMDGEICDNVKLSGNVRVGGGDIVIFGNFAATDDVRIGRYSRCNLPITVTGNTVIDGRNFSEFCTDDC